MKKATKAAHLHRKRVFCSINSIRSLCQLLKADQRQLSLMASQPHYKTFTIPKRDGGERQIEVPGMEHKRILARLNTYLQSVYLFEKSHAAYGFIVGVTNDDDRRNVLTNARKHAGRPHLLNVDLKDFFHSVTREQVVKIFSENPFRLKRGLPDLLADLTTYQGRLPMGASTSPVLSNFACRALDDDLTKLSAAMLWVYTRYADDMSFSSKQSINTEMIHSIRQIITKHHFRINEKKVHRFGPQDEKIVTGLLVTDRVTLANGYLPQLATEIQRLKEVFWAQNEQGRLTSKWAENFKLQVRGRLNFAGFVLGRQHDAYIQMKDQYYEAIHPPEEDFNCISWRGFPYGS
ncbi:MAG: reverse transcriptase family protein [Bacteroidota bacterium]